MENVPKSIPGGMRKAPEDEDKEYPQRGWKELRCGHVCGHQEVRKDSRR